MNQTSVNFKLDLLEFQAQQAMDISQELIRKINTLPYKKVEAQHIEDLARIITNLQTWNKKIEASLDDLILA